LESATASKVTKPIVPTAFQQKEVGPASAGSPSYVIAIPSHDRADTLKACTLAALVKVNVDCGTRVHIFVTSEEEAARYKGKLTAGSYQSIVVGTPAADGIGRARDFIQDHFGAGTNLVMMDDDIERFVQKYDGAVDLHQAIMRGFSLCHEKEVYMWGLNNSKNVFFMRKTYTIGWCFFQGPFMAFRVRDGIRLDPDQQNEVCEDVQYSLIHCDIDGSVLRLNGVGVKVRPCKKEPGVLQSVYSTSERAEKSKKNKAWLMRRYRDYISDWPDTKPHPRLRRSPNHAAVPLEL
jgi:hypothetical protein